MKTFRPKRVSKPLQPAVQVFWCGVCHLRVAPYEMAVRMATNIYHAYCLDKLRHRPHALGMSTAER
jgi:hypothetical protein